MAPELDHRLAARLDAVLNGMAHQRITEIPGGWDSRCFDVDGRWIVLVPRDEEVAAAHRMQARLLPWLAPKLPFEVPLAEIRAGLLVYPNLIGAPAEARTDWSALPRMLRALHGVDLARAAELCASTPSIEPWLAHYASLRSRARAIGATLGELAGPVDTAFGEFLNGDWSGEPTLVHRDLGNEHLLVREGGIAAMIDFGDATVGDPLIDFIGAHLTIGATPTRELIAEYGGLPHADRLRDYAWIGALEAVLYGLRIADPAEVSSGLAGLRERLPG